MYGRRRQGCKPVTVCELVQRRKKVLKKLGNEIGVELEMDSRTALEHGGSGPTDPGPLGPIR
jgi:hypothetical protein